MPKTKNKGAGKALLKRRKRRMIFASAKNGSIQIEGTGSVEIAAAGESGGPPRFSMNAYTGAAMRPVGWLRAEPLILDLAGIAFPKSGRIPIHRDHDTSKVVGHSEAISVDGGLQVKGLVSAANDHASEVVGTSKNGFPWQSSVGAELTAEPEFVDAGKRVRVNGKIVAGPVYVARSTKLKEVSFVSLGADDNTSAVAASDNRKGNFKMPPALAAFVKASGFDPETLSDEQVKYFEAQHTAKIQAEAQQGDGSASEGEAESIVAADGGNESVNGDDAASAIEAQAAEAFSRVAAIQAKMGDHPTLAAKAIKERWTEDKMDLELLRASRSSGPDGVAIHAKTSDYGGEHIECAMGKQIGVDGYDEKVVEHTEKLQASGHLPVNCGLQFLYHEVLRAGGERIHPSAVVDGKLITAAKRIDARFNGPVGDRQIQASSGFSTLSLPGVLSNLMNKTLLSAFMMQPSTFRRFCRISSASDFKVLNKHRTYGLGDLEELGATGEIKHTEFTEDQYQISVKTRARMIALTRVMIRNDDLDALRRIPADFGESAARTLEKSVYQELLRGVTSGFYDAAATIANQGYNANRITGPGSELTMNGIEQAETLFLEQQDRNGDSISITPSMILTGHKLKHTAEILLNKRSVVVAGDPTAGDQLRIENEFTGAFNPFSSPYFGVQGGIANASDTAWMLLGAPGSGALLDVAFLDGRQTPMIEDDDVDFNVLGHQFRAVLDWGVAQESGHYAVYSDGA